MIDIKCYTYGSNYFVWMVFEQEPDVTMTGLRRLHCPNMFIDNNPHCPKNVDLAPFTSMLKQLYSMIKKIKV